MRRYSFVLTIWSICISLQAQMLTPRVTVSLPITTTIRSIQTTSKGLLLHTDSLSWLWNGISWVNCQLPPEPITSYKQTLNSGQEIEIREDGIWISSI
ncbi:MAG: hypothetical protein NZ108_04255, partial [Bacteroidia bacterium]|nr:hypothetical protein [Bacteroidia bacterium]